MGVGRIAATAPRPLVSFYQRIHPKAIEFCQSYTRSAEEKNLRPSDCRSLLLRRRENACVRRLALGPNNANRLARNGAVANRVVDAGFCSDKPRDLDLGGTI